MTWPYVVAAIVIIIVALEIAPTVGGVLLGLIVIAALLHASPSTLNQVGGAGSSFGSAFTGI
jgi:hypothetical protein